MTFFIRNDSGGVASLDLAGAYEVADGAAIDLEVDVGGQPKNLRSAILGSTSLVQKVLVEQSWTLLEDDGSTALSLAAAKEKLQAATQQQLSNRGVVYETGTASLVSNTFTVIRSWPIGVSERATVCLLELAIEGLDDGATPRGAVFQGIGKAGRAGAAAAVKIGDAVRKADNMPADTLTFDVNGNSLELKYKVRQTVEAPWTLRYYLTYSPAGSAP